MSTSFVCFANELYLCRQRENNFIDYRKPFYVVSAWMKTFRLSFVLVAMLSLVPFVPSDAFSAQCAGLQLPIRNRFSCRYLSSNKASPLLLMVKKQCLTDTQKTFSFIGFLFAIRFQEIKNSKSSKLTFSV